MCRQMRINVGIMFGTDIVGHRACSCPKKHPDVKRHLSMFSIDAMKLLQQFQSFWYKQASAVPCIPFMPCTVQ